MAAGAARAGPSLWPNREGCLHVGMEATVIVDGAGLLQNQSDGLLRRHRHIPIAVSRGCGMDENVLVDPFDGVADLDRSLRRRDNEILHRNLNRLRMRRDG